MLDNDEKKRITFQQLYEEELIKRVAEDSPFLVDSFSKKDLNKLKLNFKKEYDIIDLQLKS